MTVARAHRLLAALATFGLFVGCGEGPSPPDRTLVRWVDEAARFVEVALPTTTDLRVENFERIGGTSATVGADQLRQALPNKRMGSDGGASVVAGGVRLRGPILYERVFSISSLCGVVAKLHVDRGWSLPPQLVELDWVPSEEELHDPEFLRKAGFVTAGRRRSFVITPDSGGTELECRIQPSATTRALLFFALTWHEEVVLQSLRLEMGDPMQGFPPLDRTTSRRNRARRVEIDRDNREALVMLTTETLQATLPRPVGRARLQLAAGLAPGATDKWVDLHLTLRSGGESTESSRRLQADEGWTPWMVPLPGDGPEIDVTVSASREGSGATVVALGDPCFVSDVARSAPPDVLLVSLDTTRRDRMQLYGNSVPNTPVLMRLAQEAVVFDDAVSPASWTLPSHASVFSGRSTQGHRVTESGRLIDGAALARRFRDAGYRTAAFTAGGYLDPTFGFVGGFERYDARDLVQRVEQEGRWVDVVTHPPRLELDRVVRSSDPNPLFLFVHTYGAHDYVVSDADLMAMGVDIPDWDTLPRQIRTADAGEQLRAADAEGKGDEFSAATRLVYDASILAGDRLLGSTIEALTARRGVPPIVCVFSDHGEELYEHGELGHGKSLSEELIRVPLVIRAPGIVAGRRAETVSLVDIAPTLLDLAGLPSLEHADGRSLVRLLQGERMGSRPALLGQLGFDAIRGQRFKFIRAGEEETLFDLESDRTEDHDLSLSKSRQFEQLRDALDAFLVDATREAGSFGEATIDPAVEEELRRLGYLGGD